MNFNKSLIALFALSLFISAATLQTSDESFKRKRESYNPFREKLDRDFKDDEQNYNRQRYELKREERNYNRQRHELNDEERAWAEEMRRFRNEIRDLSSEEQQILLERKLMTRRPRRRSMSPA